MTKDNARIDRIVHGLLQETALQNRYETKTLSEQMTRYHTPGVSIAVIKDGQIDWAQGFGVRQWGKPAPVTVDTLFQAGSISKPVFATAVMHLVQHGRIDLDRNVNDYLTSWKMPASNDWQPKVTLRQLLSHSAGLTVHGFPGYQIDEPIPTLPQILDGQAPANTPPVRVNLIPGTQFRYSGGGTTVAQLAIMDTLGQAFPEILETQVFAPLALKNSTYAQPLPAKRARQAATAHPWKYQAVKGKGHVYPEMAAAGLWTTASDLARIGIALQRAIQQQANDFLSPDLVDQMLTTQMGPLGIGFFLQGEGDTLRFGHGGSDEGFIANMTFYKHHGLGAVVMVNSNEGHPLLGEIERAIAKEYDWPDYAEKAKVQTGLTEPMLSRFIGKYKAHHPLLRIQISAGQNGSLLVKVGQQPPIPFFPESESKLYATAMNAEIHFDLPSTPEHAIGLTLLQEGQSITAQRI